MKTNSMRKIQVIKICAINIVSFHQPGPHPTLRNNNNTSPRSTGTTDSGNDSGDRHTELLRSEVRDFLTHVY